MNIVTKPSHHIPVPKLFAKLWKNREIRTFLHVKLSSYFYFLSAFVIYPGSTVCYCIDVQRATTARSS